MDDEKKFVIGIDLGGTNIASALINKSNIRIIDRVSTKTPKDYNKILDIIKSSVFSLLENNNLTIHSILHIGIGIPGSVNTQKGIINCCPNLPLSNVKIVSDLKDILNFDEISISNDANAAAYGEYIARINSGIKLNSLILITLGTGVGAGYIRGGEVFSGCVNESGFEVGHMVIKQNGKKCPCGRRGCWEQYASATALIKISKKFAKKYPNSLLNNYSLITGKLPFDLEKEGDEASIKSISLYLDYLSEGIANLINIFQPEVLTIGGGISNQGKSFIDRVKERVEPLIYNKNNMDDIKTRIETSILFNDAGLVGSALI